MSGMGGRTVKKAREQAIFKASCFRAFGMKQGHSLRIHYGRRIEKMQAHFGTATRLFPVRAKERCGLENRGLELSPPYKTDVPL